MSAESWSRLGDYWVGAVKGGLLALSGHAGYLIRLRPTPPRVQRVSLDGEGLEGRLEQLVALWKALKEEP